MKLDEFHVLLSRIELLELSVLANASAIIGVDIKPQEIDQIQLDRKEIDLRLSSYGLLKGKIISPDHQEAIQTLFHPERALIVVRDRPDIGRQVLIFLSRLGQFLLHSFPKPGQHRIVKIRPDEIEDMLTEWFPVNEGVLDDVVIMPEAQLTELIANTPDKIPPELSNIDTKLAQNLLTSIKTRKWGGSFLLLELQEGKAVKADSWLAWSGGEQTWMAGLHDKPGMMRLSCGGERFSGLRRQIVRRLGQFERIVRAYALSSEELAYSLSLLNRSDLAGQWVRDVSPDELDERMQKAARDLETRGLCGISPKGFPLLASDFEHGLAPMIVPSHVGLIKTISGRGTAAGTLYVQKDRSFCVHFPKGGRHVLESGKIEQLSSYLMTLFKGFGEKKVVHSKPAPILLQALTDCLELKDQPLIKAKLQKSGFASSLASQLADDILQHEYRASLNGIVPNGGGGKEAVIPTLFLLKGSKHDWLFAFHNSKADTIGKVMIADRKNLLEQLNAIVSLPNQ